MVCKIWLSMCIHFTITKKAHLLDKWDKQPSLFDHKVQNIKTRLSVTRYAYCYTSDILKVCSSVSADNCAFVVFTSV